MPQQAGCTGAFRWRSKPRDPQRCVPESMKLNIEFLPGFVKMVKKRSVIFFGSVAFIGATIMMIGYFKDQDSYPAWVLRSFLTLATTVYLWSILNIVMSLELFPLTKTQFALLRWLSTALAGVIFGIAITLGLAGYMR
jgi:hypothetical protein